MLLLLLQLGVLLERKTRIPGVRGCKLAWWRPCTDWGRGLDGRNTPLEGRGRAQVSGNCHVLFLWDLEA